jgi:hypothetical protein
VDEARAEGRRPRQYPEDEGVEGKNPEQEEGGARVKGPRIGPVFPRIPSSRRCITCKLVRVASDFYQYVYITGNGKGSVRSESRCKDCSRQRRRSRHAVNREAENTATRLHHGAHREELRKYDQERRLKDLDKYRRDKVVSENKRRLRGFSRTAPHVKIEIEQALDMALFGDKYLDAYAGEFIERPTIDHIVPLHAGGTNTYDNLCVTSRANNSSKHRTSLLAWLVRRRADACRAS